MLIELTMLTQDKANGKKFYVSHDTILSLTPVEIDTESVHIIGQTKKQSGSHIWFIGGQKQMVQEDMYDVVKLVNEACKSQGSHK